MRPSLCGRASVGALASFAVVLAGCAAAAKPLAPDDGRRHPDGIAVDPLEYTPEPQEMVSAGAGVVALRTPLGAEAAKETTRSFLLAIAQEDLEALRKTMSPDASSINPATRARESSFYFFSRRFGRLDYTYLSNVGFWQEERVELYRAGEASSLWADTVGPSATPGLASTSSMSDVLEPADIVVRVPLAVPRSSSGQLLGDELLLLLRRSGGRYVVHRIVEEFTLQ